MSLSLTVATLPYYVDRFGSSANTFQMYRQIIGRTIHSALVERGVIRALPTVAFVPTSRLLVPSLPSWSGRHSSDQLFAVPFVFVM
jgi:hypothetical protein